MAGRNGMGSLREPRAANSVYVYKKAPAFGGKELKAGAVKSCKFEPAALLVILIFQKIYSVLRLRSQLTKPIPMLPNKTAPGAGIASD